MKEKIMMILRGQRPLVDVWHYILGNWRYKLYYSKFTHGVGPDRRKITRADIKRHPLMRQHIWEQIVWRIKWMNPICYEQGSCVKCGCETTALQMANKSCDMPCYPPMMKKDEWEKFKNGKNHVDKKTSIVWRTAKKGKPFIYFKP